MKNFLPYALIWSFSLFAHPQNPQAIHGDIQLLCSEESPHFLTIEASNQAIVNWDSFSIQEGEVVHFSQETDQAAILNRVVGLEKSEIFGSLTSNAAVYLLNPNGILIGPNGVIDVGSFIASCFDISNEAFLEQRDEVLFRGDSTEVISQEGKIFARKGDLLLLAHRVENKGDLSAEKGSLLLGAGHDILLIKEKDKPLSLKIELPGDGVDNQGTIKALFYLIEANCLPFSLGLNNSGTLDALNIENEGGEIVLKVENGPLKNEGFLFAKKSVDIEAKNGRVENLGQVEALGGTIFLAAYNDSPHLVDQKPVINLGTFNVSGDQGEIAIYAPKWINTGSLLADGLDGKISLFVPGTYIETKGALISVQGERGQVNILAGNYFSSGKINATGVDGGKIFVEAELLAIPAARFDASGKLKGGEISLSSFHTEEPCLLNTHTSLAVNGQQQGTLTIHSTAPDAKEPCSCLLVPSSQQEPLLWTFFVQEKKDCIPFAMQRIACPPTVHELSNAGVSDTTSFGEHILVLSNGNIAVGKPNDDTGGIDAGAAFLYDGSTFALLSTLTGSTGDTVSSDGFFALTNGNYLILSSSWNNAIGPALNAGAVTFANGSTGITGTVSSSNSLVGTSADDAVGSGSHAALTNGNYVIASPSWNNQTGAATWGNGTTGITGAVAMGNSLLGAVNSDQVASNGIVALTNGNYVVVSPLWNNGGIAAVGAVTWGNGTTGNIGIVSTSNSLVGVSPGDQVGSSAVVALTNGNYVVGSPLWDDSTGPTADVGAVTWVDGSAPNVDTVNTLNSLVGSSVSDQVGSVITALTNGNFVASTQFWDDGMKANVGAVTWGNGTTGIVGTVSAMNSLRGLTAGDAISNEGVTALANGNYVISSPFWSNGGLAGAGAATWADGNISTTDPVSVFNSLYGSTAGDGVASAGCLALTNGNFIVLSPTWNNPGEGKTDVGAATWVDGTTGTLGAVATTNSLYGGTSGDAIGSDTGGLALTNGKAAILSQYWHNANGDAVGAVTVISGTGLSVGTVNATNSITGSSDGDSLGNRGAFNVSSTQFVVFSSAWKNGSNANAGAVTILNSGTGAFCIGTFGEISASNSFVGVNASTGMRIPSADNIGNGLVVASFSSYSGASRVFVIKDFPLPSFSVAVPSRGLHDFASVISDGYALFPPQPLQTFSPFFGLLNFRLPSLLNVIENPL